MQGNVRERGDEDDHICLLTFRVRILRPECQLKSGGAAIYKLVILMYGAVVELQHVTYREDRESAVS